MKKIILPLLFALAALFAHSQTAFIQWQKSLGGSGGDTCHTVIPTFDGGYAVVGSSVSNNGNVTGNHGNSDYWVVKLSSTGSVEWQKSLGGSLNDIAYTIIQTTDSNYVIAGSTTSTSGNVTGNHGNADFWVVKINGTGTILWQRALGGSGDDFATSIVQTADLGFAVAGYSNSGDGDVTGNHGSTADFWLVKLDTAGTLQWQKSYGGYSEDRAQSVIQTNDGGYAVAGYSNSTDGDVTGNNGAADYWVVKTGNWGSVEWQKSLGGSSGDKAQSILQTSNDDYVLAGYSFSSDGDVTNQHGNGDYWVVKINNTGTTILWQKAIGGSDNDQATSIMPTTGGGFAVGGSSYSNNGDATLNHGVSDYWLVTLSDTGAVQGQKSFGGSNNDEAFSLSPGSDGGFVIAGSSFSNNGDVTGNHGSTDYWVVKVGSCDLTPPVITLSGPATFCEGDSLILTSSYGSGNFWSQGGATQSIVIYNAGLYIDTVRNLSGCAVSNATTVVVITNPSASVSPSSVTICSGRNVQLTASGGGTYNWSNSLGSSASPTVSAVSNTTYTVTVTGAGNCTATASSDVIVDNPAASISPDSLSTCPGIASSLTASNGSTYTWSNSLGTTQQVTIYPTSNTVYTVTVTSVYNCTATASSVVTIDIPVPTISPDSIDICNGGSTTLTVIGGNYYNWSNSLGSNVQVTVSPTTNAVYTVTVTYTNNCTATASAVVTVNNNMVVGISPASAAICNGLSATLTANGGNSYVWSNSLGTTAQVTVSPISSSTYQVTATDLNSCSGTASVTVTVKEPAAQSLCMVTVDSNSTHNVVVWEKTNQQAIDSFYIYREISTGNYSQIGVVHRDSLSEFHDYAANPNITAYRYRISVKDTCGSEGVISNYHNTIHLQYLGTGNLQWNVYAIENASTPVSSFDVYRDTTGTGNWQLLVSVPGNQTTTTDINYNQSLNMRYRVLANWSFSCTPTRSSYAGVLSNVRTVAANGLEETGYANINFYPNPATDQLNIQIDEALVGAQLNIYDLAGSLLQTATLQMQNSKLQIQNHPRGVYIAEIKTNELSVKRRWVKM